MNMNITTAKHHHGSHCRCERVRMLTSAFSLRRCSALLQPQSQHITPSIKAKQVYIYVLLK